MKKQINFKILSYALLLMLLVLCTEDDPIEFRLTTNCVPEKTGAVSPESGMFTEGAEIQLKATANPEYIFKNWEGDALGYENPMTITMTKNKAITAVFEKVDYSLTIEVIGEGTINQEIVPAKSTSKDYKSGTIVQLTANPENGWRFVEWSGDLTETENPVQITMDQAMSIKAKFEKITYSLSINIEGNGEVNEEIVQAKFASTDYETGTTVQLTAIPNAEWIFIKWTGDYEGTENPIQITIDKPKTIEAIFEIENAEKTYVPDDNFEKALINLGYDDELDDYVSTQRIKNIEEIRLDNKGIQDLTGIEAFESLKMLVLTNNLLENFDISQNSKLEQLICNENQLTSLDISRNYLINYLISNENELTCVQVNEQQLFMINLGGGMNGPWFITDDDVNFSINCDITNEDRTYIPDDGFEQTLIDLGLDDILNDYVKTTAIFMVKELNISNKNISDLTGLQDFNSLITLDASNNNISSIDPYFGSSFGYAFAVGTLILNNNKLNSLDISSLHILGLLDVTNNPLNCIQVNENQLSTIENGYLIPMVVKKDDGVIISEDCSTSYEQKTYIPDDGFEETLIEMSLDDTMDDYVKTINIMNLENLDISSKNISNLEGLQDFKRLVFLNASNNNISSIPEDFGIKWGSYPPAPWAGSLDLSNNNLSDLNISQLNFFRTLDVRNNPLNCIEVNENQLLYFEDAPGNFKLDEGVNLSTDCGN